MKKTWALPLAAGVLAATGSGGAHAQETPPGHMIILDRNLQRTSARLEGLSPSTIQYTDASGRSRSIERARVLAVYTAPGVGAAIPPSSGAGAGGNAGSDTGAGQPGVLSLTDGQVVPGFFVASESAGEEIGWRSRRLGRFSVPLERASRILFFENQPLEARRQRDSAVLVNGDRLEGFVETIGSELVMESDGKKTPVPMDRVAMIALANPPEPGQLPLVYLTDGSVLAASELTSASAAARSSTGNPASATAQWALASESGTGVVDLDSIAAVLFEPRAMVPLASLAIESVRGTGDRRWTPQPTVGNPESAPMGLATITISGPAQVDWKLPQGIARLGATITLPAEAAAWGNASISIQTAAAGSGGFREIVKVDLTSEKPSAELIADVGGAGLLRIEITGKAYGPVQSRVMLEQPVLLRKAELRK